MKKIVFELLWWKIDEIQPKPDLQNVQCASGEYLRLGLPLPCVAFSPILDMSETLQPFLEDAASRRCFLENENTFR